jgi:prephenate dehydrogenase
MKIAIVGIGRIGSWLAGCLEGEYDLAIFDRERGRLGPFRRAVHLGCLKELEGFSPELFLNAVSLQSTVDVFREALPYLPPECLLGDLASIKGEIPGYYLEARRRFVSTHPMFGPNFADLGRLDRENAVIISESDPEGAAFFRRFFGRLNLNIFTCSFSEHDRMMAYSLTMPFVSSMVFAANVDTQAVPGTTFKRHLEVARGVLSEDDQLLAEVLFNPHSLGQVEKVARKLDFLTHIIRARDFEEAAKVFGALRKNLG